LFVFFLMAWFLILAKLFYWQVIKSEELAAAARNQQESEEKIFSPRGSIYSADGFPLSFSRKSYLLFLEPEKVSGSDQTVSASAAREKKQDLVNYLKDFLAYNEDKLNSVLNNPKIKWFSLGKILNEEEKVDLESKSFSGLGFEEQWERYYPEASMAAHLLGFVAADEKDKERGYFGLEGFYNQELKGIPGIKFEEKDLFGREIIIGQEREKKSVPGRDLYLSLDRSVQFLAERKLKDKMEKYGAVSGSVIVMDPFSGAIIAMASFPSFDQAHFSSFPGELFPNPAISFTFEPGSIIKPLVMAAAFDTGAVNRESRCDICTGPVTIGQYSIKTWNEKYYPDSLPIEIIQHSDNVGMVYTARRLGIAKIYDYFKKFGFDERTGIDLEGEAKTKLKDENNWQEIDLATASFGQGIAVTPLQMVRAISVLANGGNLVKPWVVARIKEGDRIVFTSKPEFSPVIKPATAKIIKEMMVNAVENGESKWAKPKGYRIAGKTGTAQIPVAGHYDQEKTIASFIGFAPAEQPRFAMLVTLREPKTSPWGSETAAPLWFEIAKGIFEIWGIPPG